MCSALFTLFLLVTILVLSSSSNVYATETATNYNLSGTNKSTGYEYILEDSANFIDDAVKGKLISQMKKTTEYCNIAVVTTTSHPYGSTESYAVNTFEGYFGTGANGVIFVIDRDLNEIYLACEGSTQRTIPNSKCNSICDNTYIYATSSHDYDSPCRRTYITASQIHFEHLYRSRCRHDFLLCICIIPVKGPQG